MPGQLPFEFGGEVGEFGERQPLAQPGQCGGAFAQLFRCRGIQQQQLAVLAGSDSWIVRESRLVRRTTRAFSITICALMPPNPIADTPALTGWSAGHSSAVSGSRRAGFGPASSGWVSWCPVAGGITWW